MEIVLKADLLLPRFGSFRAEKRTGGTRRASEMKAHGAAAPGGVAAASHLAPKRRPKVQAATVFVLAIVSIAPLLFVVSFVTRYSGEPSWIALKSQCSLQISPPGGGALFCRCSEWREGDLWPGWGIVTLAADCFFFVSSHCSLLNSKLLSGLVWSLIPLVVFCRVFYRRSFPAGEQTGYDKIEKSIFFFFFTSFLVFDSFLGN